MIKKKIVVTGGAGFIGSNLVRTLAGENEVIVIDDLSTGYLKNIKDLSDDRSIRFIKGSITDLGFLQKTFKDIDYVFHEAAIPSVTRSIEDPIRSNYVNVAGTLNVLVAGRDNSVEKVVCASSSSVYGDTPTLPKRENMSLHPLAPYAVNKLCVEYYCQVFTSVYNLPTVSLRYFNVYGPRQDPTSEYAAVIPNFITRILRGDPPIIYGDGEQTRDFTFINDVVHANILAAESNAYGVFNIAGGKQISIGELAKLITTIFKKDLNLIYKEPRPGDIKHSLADISKARTTFGYEPKFDITDGLNKTINWFLKQV